MRSLLHWLRRGRRQQREGLQSLHSTTHGAPSTAEHLTESAVAQGEDGGEALSAEALQLIPWSMARLSRIARELQERPSQEAIQAARAARGCLERFWLVAPVDALETLFAGPIGEVYRQFLAGVLPALPLDSAETTRQQQLSERLARGLACNGSINVLLALLLYSDREAMQVSDPLRHLPAWLLPLYAERCEPGLGAVGATSPRPSLPTSTRLESTPVLPDLAPITGEACMALIGDAEFLGRLSGLVNLYGLEPDDPEIRRDLSQGRRQVAQVWLDVETQQLEALYRTPFGQLTDNLVASGFAREGLSQDERALRQQLVELAADLHQPRALNALMALLLYFPIEQVTLPEDATLLPVWLLQNLRRLGARPAHA